MAANLQRVNEWDGLRGFTNLVYKENRAWLGTRRWWINSLIWPVLLGGLVANMIFVPAIVDLARPEEVAQAGGVTAYVILTGLSVFFEFGAQAVGIGVIVLCQDLIIDERQSGIVDWILTKPVTRRAYVVAKLIANMVFILLFLVGIPSILTYILFYIRMGMPYPWLPFTVGVGIMSLHSLFYLTLTLMLGTLFSSRPPVMGIALGVLLGGNLLAGLIKPLLYISPWSLAKLASLVAGGQLVPFELFLLPIAATAMWCIVFVIVALAKFEKLEF